MANQEGLTTKELEIIRESPSRLWHYYCSEPCFESAKSALLQLMKFTLVFKSECQQLRMELKQNMLSFIENTLSLIRFMTNSFDDLNHTSVDALNEFRNDIVLVSVNLENCSNEVQDQLLRIDSDFRDIVAAREKIRQLEESGSANISHTEGGSEAWQPFFSSPNRFKTDVEKDLISNLRGLYLRVGDLKANELLEGLVGIFESTPADTLIFSSESSRDTAMRSVLILLSALRQKAEKEFTFNGLTGARKSLLESFFKIMSSVTSTQEKVESSVNYGKLCHVRWHCMMSLIHPMYEGKSSRRSTRGSRIVLEQEPKPGSSSISLLWRKLRNVKSVDELLDAEERSCSICQAEDITTTYFAILDVCTHIFCKHCIEDWFKNHDDCPNCRKRVRSWTTKKFFSRFLKRNSTVVEQSLPEAGNSTNGAVEQSLLEAGNATNGAVEQSLSEAGNSTNGAVEQSLPEAGNFTNGAVEQSLPEAGNFTNGTVKLSLPETSNSTNGAVEQSLLEAGNSTNGAVEQSLPEAGNSTNGAVEQSLPGAGSFTNGAVKLSLPETGNSTNGAVEQSLPEAGNFSNGAVKHTLPEAGNITNEAVKQSLPLLEAGPVEINP